MYDPARVTDRLVVLCCEDARWPPDPDCASTSSTSTTTPSSLHWWRRRIKTAEQTGNRPGTSWRPLQFSAFLEFRWRGQSYQNNIFTFQIFKHFGLFWKEMIKLPDWVFYAAYATWRDYYFMSYQVCNALNTILLSWWCHATMSNDDNDRQF